MFQRKSRLRYWVVDARDFGLYVALAFFAGVLPALANSVSSLLLLVLACLAGVVALLLWMRNRRKYGIGVHVHIPSTRRDMKESDMLEFAKWLMGKRHRDWFRSGPPITDSVPESRVDWAIETIRHRLREMQRRDGDNPPIFLYFHCRLQESFVLGRKHNELSDISASRRVRSVSQQGDHAYGYEVELDAVQRFRCDIDRMPRSRSIVQTRPIIELTSGHYDGQVESSSRLALIVNHFEEHDDSFVNDALRAAKGENSVPYHVNHDDGCDHALVVDISIDYFVADLQRAKAERAIADIFGTCADSIKRIYGVDGVPVRVFMKGPAILAFALGALLDSNSRLIEYSGTCDARSVTAPLEKDSSVTNEERIIAIIDGDDVGAKSERLLLSGDLEAASEYSRWAGETLGRIVGKLGDLPGVETSSDGGDSAIFTMNAHALDGFLRELDRLRVEQSFNVSCGYGTGSKDAFHALRLAKTSGKNVSAGSS